MGSLLALWFVGYAAASHAEGYDPCLAANTIVFGEVTAIASEYQESAWGRFISSDVELEVSWVARGEVGRSVSVYTSGGTVGGVGMSIGGSKPRFEVGQRYLVLMNRMVNVENGQAEYVVVTGWEAPRAGLQRARDRWLPQEMCRR